MVRVGGGGQRGKQERARSATRVVASDLAQCRGKGDRTPLTDAAVAGCELPLSFSLYTQTAIVVVPVSHMPVPPSLPPILFKIRPPAPLGVLVCIRCPSLDALSSIFFPPRRTHDALCFLCALAACGPPYRQRERGQGREGRGESLTPFSSFLLFAARRPPPIRLCSELCPCAVLCCST